MAKRKVSDAVTGENRIRELRKGAGLTAQELAAKLTEGGYKCHYSTIIKIEGGGRSIQKSMLEALGKIFGVAPESIMVRGGDARLVRIVPVYPLSVAYRPGDQTISVGEVAVFDASESSFAISEVNPLEEFKVDLRGVVVCDPDDRVPSTGCYYVAVADRIYDIVFVEASDAGPLFLSATIEKSPPHSVTIIGRCTLSIATLPQGERKSVV